MWESGQLGSSAKGWPLGVQAAAHEMVVRVRCRAERHIVVERHIKSKGELNPLCSHHGLLLGWGRTSSTKTASNSMSTAMRL